MTNKHPVFVYGTLMRGERAEAFLRNSEYVGKFLRGGTCKENGRAYSGASDPTPPSRAYLQLIEDALCRELVMSGEQAKAYLERCL